MKHVGSVISLFMAALVFGMGGCAPRPRAVQPVAYGGLTAPMSVVLQQIDANNRALPTLYARTYIEASIIDEKGKSRFVNTGGDLFVRKPREMLLRGRKDLAGKIFELGSTVDRFWLTVYVDEGTRWWGHYRNVGKPCMKEMPIRPDLVGEVLGIGNISLDFNEVPVPTMVYNNDVDVYMVAWHGKRPDQWYTEKQIWYDRKTLLPRKVLLYDQNGRVVLRADLSRHQVVEVDALPRDRWPRIATFYDLYFPETGSKMTIELSDMALQSDRGHPREGTIVFRNEPEVREIQIDEACGE